MGQTRTNVRPYDTKRNFFFKLNRVSLKHFREVWIMKDKGRQSAGTTQSTACWRTEKSRLRSLQRKEVCPFSKSVQIGSGSFFLREKVESV